MRQRMTQGNELLRRPLTYRASQCGMLKNRAWCRRLGVGLCWDRKMFAPVQQDPAGTIGICQGTSKKFMRSFSLR